MTPAEWAEISGADDPICAFYHYWTRKEAAIKADGRGMVIPLQEICLSGQSAWIETQEWHLQPLPLAVGYNCYLATQNLVDEIREFDAGNLPAGLANRWQNGRETIDIPCSPGRMEAIPDMAGKFCRYLS